MLQPLQFPTLLQIDSVHEHFETETIGKWRRFMISNLFEKFTQSAEKRRDQPKYLNLESRKLQLLF